MPGGPARPARPRWKRSNTASSSPGSTPGPSSRTSIAPGRATSVTRAAAVVQRVLDQRVERAVEVGGRGVHRARAGAPRERARRARRSARRPRRAAAREVDAPRRARRPRPPGRAAAARRPSRPGGRPRASAAVDLLAPRVAASARASSSRSRRPASGVRSWCEASATNSRWLSTQPLEPRGHLVERARERAAARRSPRPARGRAGRPRRRGAAASSSRRSGPAIWRAISAPAPRPSSSTSAADRDEAEDRRARGAADGLDALGDAHRALAAGRAASTGTAVARISCVERVASGAGPGSGGRAARRRSPGGSRSRRRAGRRRRSRRPARPRRVDDHDAAAGRLRATVPTIAAQLGGAAELAGGGRGDDLGLARAPASAPRRRRGRAG